MYRWVLEKLAILSVLWTDFVSISRRMSMWTSLLHIDRSLATYAINLRCIAAFEVSPTAFVFIWLHLKVLLPNIMKPKQLLWVFAFFKTTCNSNFLRFPCSSRWEDFSKADKNYFELIKQLESGEFSAPFTSLMRSLTFAVWYNG